MAVDAMLLSEIPRAAKMRWCLLGCPRIAALDPARDSHFEFQDSFCSELAGRRAECFWPRQKGRSLLLRIPSRSRLIFRVSKDRDREQYC